MVSDRCRLQWGAYAQARGHDTAVFQARDELHRFLVGLHLRGEVLSAADLGSLLDEAGVDAAERDELVERIHWGLALLDSYRARVEEEQAEYDEVREYGGFEI